MNTESGSFRTKRLANFFFKNDFGKHCDAISSSSQNFLRSKFYSFGEYRNI